MKHRAAILRPIASHAFASEEPVHPLAILERAVLAQLCAPAPEGAIIASGGTHEDVRR